MKILTNKSWLVWLRNLAVLMISITMVASLGWLESVWASGDKIEENIIKGAVLSVITDEVDDEGELILQEISKYIEENGPLPNPNEDGYIPLSLNIRYDFELLAADNHQNGDYFVFFLPEEFFVANDVSGVLARTVAVGDVTVVEVYGSYQLDKDRKVTLTFNEKIVGEDVVGWVEFSTRFDESGLGNDLEQKIEVEIKGEKTVALEFSFLPLVQKTIDKTLIDQDKAYNTEVATWQVDFNKNLDSIENFILKDPLDDDLALISESVKLYELVVNLDGTLSQGDLVYGSIGVGDVVSDAEYVYEVDGFVYNDQLVIEKTDGEKEFQLKFVDPVDSETLLTLESAYRLIFQTEITDDDRKIYENTATMTGDDFDDVSDDDDLEVRRGTPLAKSSTGYVDTTQTVDWEIRFNYNQKVLDQEGSVITDDFGLNQKLVGGIEDIEIWKMAIDENGGATENQKLFIIDDYTIDAAFDGNGNITGFVITFTGGINEAHRITYATTAIDRIFVDTSFTNTVNAPNVDNPVVASRAVNQSILSKTRGAIDYLEKTVSWSIRINRDSYEMNNLVIDDTFENWGLSVDDLNNIILTYDAGGSPDYEVYEKDDDRDGFRIELKETINQPITITYTTDFDYQARKDSDDNRFVNEVDISWVDEEGETQNKSDTAVFTPDTYTQQNGYKQGTYDATTENKTITWQIGVNYNLQNIDDASVTDYIDEGQEFLFNTVKVYNATRDPNDTENILVIFGEALDLPYGDITIEDLSGGDDQGFKVNFGDITGAYIIEYEIHLRGEVIDAKYDNTATLSGEINSVSVDFPLTGTVDIPNGDQYVNKSVNYDGGRIADWTVIINPGQSTISNVVITDLLDPDDKHLFLSDTLTLSSTTVDTDGSIAKDSELSLGDDYTLEVDVEAVGDDGPYSFRLSINGEINTAYILEYQTFILVKNGETFKNDVKLTAAGLDSSNQADFVQKEFALSVGAGGIYSSPMYDLDELATLEIIKEGIIHEGVTPIIPSESVEFLEGVEFELYYLIDPANPDDESSRILVGSGFTDSSGKLTFSNIGGGEYILKEIEASLPDDYAIRGNGERRIEISTRTVGPPDFKKVITIKNDNKNNIELNKTATEPSPLTPGSPVQYEIEIKNTGDVAFYNTTIVDVLPVGMRVYDPTDDVENPIELSVDGGAPLPGSDYTEYYNPGTGELTWELVNPLAVGQTLLITYTAKVDDDSTLGAAKELTNTVMVTWNSQDGMRSYETTDDETITIASASLEKSASKEKVTIGETFTYTLAVTVPANTTLYDAKVTDTIPDGLSVRTTTTSTGSVTVDDNIITWNIFSTGESTDYINDTGNEVPLTLEIEVLVLDELTILDGIEFNNTAFLKWYVSAVAEVPENVSDSAQVTVTEPDLTLGKSNIPVADPLVGGSTVNYSIEISHTADSTSDAYEIVVTDILPDGISIADVATDVEVKKGSDSVFPDSVTYVSDTLTITMASDFTLVVGETLTVTYTATVDDVPGAGGVLVNTAKVDYKSWGENGRLYDAEHSSSITIASATFDKTVSQATATIGETFTYTLVVTVPANTTLYDAKVTDTIPAGLEIISEPPLTPTAGSVTVTGNQIEWNIFSSEGDDPDYINDTPDEVPLTLAILVQVLNETDVVDGFEFNNIAELEWKVAADSAEPENVSDDAQIPVTEPDLTLAKSNEYTEPLVGGSTVNYTIAISHTADSTSDAYLIVVTDQLPDGISIADVDTDVEVKKGSDPVTPESVTYVSDTLTITMDPSFILALGETLTVTYTATVDNVLGAGSVLVNTAKVDYKSWGENGRPYDAEHSSSITIASASLEKTADKTTVTIGETFTYTLKVTVPANTTLYDAKVTDTIPAGLLIISEPPLSPTAGSVTVNGNQIEWNIFSSEGDDPAYINDTPDEVPLTLAILVQVLDETDVVDGFEFNNIAELEWKVAADEVETENDSATAQVTVVEPYLVLKKENNVTQPIVGGQTVIYDITIKNDGTSTAYLDKLVDILPVGMRNSGKPDIFFVRIKDGQEFFGQGSSWDNTLGKFTIDLSGIELEVSEVLEIRYEALVDNSVEAGTVLDNNIASVKCSSWVDEFGRVTDINIDSNQDNTDDSGFDVSNPEISLIKTATLINGSEPNPFEYSAIGDVITYSFTVENTGNVTLTDVIITDLTATVAGGPLASLAPSALNDSTFTATYTVTQADIDAGKVENTATVSGKDPQNLDVTDDGDETVLADQVASLALTKTADPQTYSVVGQTITYSFTVENTGNVTLTSVGINEESFTGTGSAPVPSFVNADQGSSEGTLKPGETATYKATYAIAQADITAGQVDNAAKATGNYTDAAGVPKTVTDEDDERVTTQQDASIELIKTAVADPVIPTYSEVGDLIAYEITLENTGNVPVYDPAVIDDDATAGPTYDSGDTNTNDVLDVGETWIYTASYEVTQADLDRGFFTNMASGTGQADTTGDGQGDTEVEDDDDETVNADQNSSLALTKTADPQTYSVVGQTITYSFTVENTGNVTLTSVEINEESFTGTGSAPVPSFFNADQGSSEGTLKPGETATYKATYAIAQADITAGQVDNAAKATGNYTDAAGVPKTVTDEDDERVTTDQDASISVSKTAVADPGIPTYSEVGDLIAYEITLENTGNVPVYDPAVIDDDATAGPTYDSGDTNTNDVLDVGETWIYTASYEVTQEDLDRGFFANIANATGSADTTGDGEGDTPVEDSDDETVYAEQNPDIDLTKTADPQNFSVVGQVITYTFTVINTGNVTLTEVVIDDAILGISNLAVDPSTLAPGDTGTTTAIHLITPTNLAVGFFNNTATATGSYTDAEGDPQTTSDSDSETITENQDPTISITKELKKVNEDDSLTEYSSVGDVLTYEISLENNGNVRVYNPQVSDPQATTGPTYVSGDDNFNNILDPGETWIYSATYTVIQANLDAGDFKNTATGTGSADTDGDGIGDTGVSDTADLTVLANQDAELNISKIADPQTYSAVGEVITYTFTVENTGNVTITDITIEDDLFTVPGTIASLSPGGSDEITYDYIITQDEIDAGSLFNTARATGEDPVDDEVTSGDDDETVIGPDRAPLLTVTKSADPQTYSAVGEVITYTIVVENTGNVTITGIDVKDPLTGLDTTKASLAPGESETYTETYTIAQADIDNGEVVNTATAAGKAPGDEDVNGEDDETVTGPDRVPLLTVTKSADPQTYSAVGEVITYTIVLVNTGNVTITGIDVEDPLTGLVDTIASLAPGESSTYTETYTIIQADIDNGEVENIATAAGKAPGDEDVNGEDDETVTGSDRNPVLTLVKSASTSIYSAVGDVIIYTFTVSNTGNVTITNITIDDDLFTVTSTIASLAPSASGDITYEYTITQSDLDTGSVANTARAVGQDPSDSDVTSEDDSETVTGPLAGPALTLDKSASPSTYTAVGEVITYTFTVNNIGNVTITDIAIDDDLFTVPSTIASLAPGASGDITYEYTITQSDLDTGSVANTARAVGQDPSDSDVTSEDDSETVTGPLAGPALTLDKSASPSTYTAVGEVITYTFTVNNIGNVTITDIAIDDDLFTVPSTIASLAPGASGDITYEYTITQSDLDAGSVANTARAVGQDPGDSDVTSEDDSETVTGPAAGPALTLDKSASPSNYSAVGEVITYTFTVTNTGNVTITNITIDDGLFTVSGTIASLAPGASGEITYEYTITQSDFDAGNVVNTARAIGKDPGQGDVTSVDDDVMVNGPAAGPAISLNKSASPSTYSVVGDLITYTFTVNNNGNVTLEGVTVTEIVFSGTGSLSAPAYVYNSSTQGSLEGKLLPSESATYTATYTIGAGDIGAGRTLVNEAMATGNDPQGDPVTANDDATVTYVAPFIPDPSPEVPVTLVPSINIKKYVSVDGGANWLDAEATPGPNVEVGREVRFKFVVTNSGNVTLSDIRLSDSVMDLSAAPVPALLAPGGSFDYIIGRAAVAGQHSNTAIAQGTYNQAVYSDSDLGHYFGVFVEQTPVPAPAVIVKKYVSVDGGTTWLDAETITGPSVAVGSSVRFKYVITNSGNVTLSNVRLTDNRFSLSGAVLPFSLEAGRSYEYVLNQVAVAGQHSNTATVTGEYNQQIYRDTDMAHYFGFEPDDERETEQDQPVSGTVDLPDDATPRIGRPPANGIATVDEDGNWVYTPNPGFSGRDQFTIMVRKADGTEYEVTIEIMVDEPTVSPIDEPEADKPVTPTPRTAGVALASLYSLWLILVASFALRRGVGRKDHLAAKLRN